MYFKYLLEFHCFIIVSGSFTVNPPSSGTNCTGQDVQITWTYSPPSGETALLVNWKKNGNSILVWTVSTNSLNYGNGYDATKISHVDSNGQIALLNVDSTTSGEYTCEVIYSPSSTTVPSQSFQLEVIDTITTSMICACNESEINCVLPSPISQVTINDTLRSLPFRPHLPSLYVVCMTGDATSCLANSIERCEIIDLCPKGALISRDTTCDAKLIYAVHFIGTLSVAVLSFLAVIFIKMKRPKIGSKYILIFAAVLIDVVLECIMLWGIEYGSDFQTFRTNDVCNVVKIGVVCHVVIIVILVIKVVVLIYFTERIQECIATCCVPRKTTETTVESGPLTNRSNDHSSTNGVKQAVPPHTSKITQAVTTPEDITLLMHFPMPTGYQVHHWIKEDSISLQDSNRHVTSDRGTLHIRSATAEDNGIYQSLLVSGNSELRVNVILHVTGLKSVSLMVDPLVWRQIKNKKLKQIHDLKTISKNLSINNVEGIPSNLKRSEETDVTVKSIRWTHNGKEITGPSPWKSGNNHLQRFTVKRETPIDEYHCKIEFSDRKSHIFIFIVKFTGSEAKPNLYPSDSLPNDKVDPIEEVVGVPTIINTKREGTDSKLKPLRRLDQRNSDDDDS